MKNKAAVSLGKLGGKAKNAKLTAEQRKAMMAEVRKGIGVHSKLNTFDCGVPNCKATNGHEHTEKSI
jgi:hypothetical protein